MRIDIIGAGPSGSYAAYLLAKNGHDVSVFDKKQDIGKPVQCTGILSEHFLKIMKPSKEFVLNEVTTARIYAPNGKSVNARIKKNYVVCRKKFDSYIANLAKSTGAKFHMEHSFHSLAKGNRISTILYNKGKKVKSSCDILIGADGPLSPVSKAAGIYKNRKFVIGSQIEAVKKNDNCVEFYPYIGCYAWIVPVNEKVVRIGVSGYKDTVKELKEICKTKKIGLTLENQSGIIPIFDPSVKTQEKNIFILGDAATMVKATTGGGINQGLMAARILSECIKNRKNFDIAWRSKMHLNLYFHLIAHKIMQKFSITDWNFLIEEFSKPDLRKILHDESRDDIMKMMMKIAIKRPKLFIFAKYLAI
ncbi:MAG: NAD(P)/FAD-dependent oxidoreductase [Candidatus Woesearchaeota archaeon]|nr:NAD(P)/FAD-dependent oxidoreductase [Candidatus Woesearchaeota archaeon]